MTGDRRGPHYAGRLTAQEQHTLDVLISAVARRQTAAPTTRKRRWTRPVAAGVAAAGILLAGTATRIWTEPAVPASTGSAALSPDAGGPDAGGPPETDPGAADWLGRLAGAAGTGAQQPTPVPGRKLAAVHEAVHIGVRGHPDACRISALGVLVLLPLPGPVPTAHGQVEIRPTRVPVEAAAVAACPMATPGAHSPRTGSLPAFSEGSWGKRRVTWAARGYWLGAEPVPVRQGQRELLATPPAEAGAGRWWAAFVDELTNPYVEAAGRVTALRTAEAWARQGGDVRLLPERSRDLAGRPVVAFRIPYQRDGAAVAANLLLDRATGAVAQVEVRSPVEEGAGFDIIVYLRVGAVDPKVLVDDAQQPW